jgi:hypothetical protein
MDVLKKFGTLWHFYLFVWSFVLVVLVRENVSIWVSRLNNGLFILSVLVLFPYYHFRKNFNNFWRVKFRKVATFAKLILFTTMPAFFVSRMWIPLQKRIMCRLFYPSHYDPSKECCPYISVLLASVFTVIVMVCESKDFTIVGTNNENQSANTNRKDSVGETNSLDNNDDSEIYNEPCSKWENIVFNIS